MHSVSSGSPLPPAYANEIIAGYDEPTRDTQYVRRWSSLTHSDANDRTPCAYRTCFFAIVQATLPPAKKRNNGFSIPRGRRQNSSALVVSPIFLSSRDGEWSGGHRSKNIDFFNSISILLTFFTNLTRRFFANVCEPVPMRFLKTVTSGVILCTVYRTDI